MDAIKGNRRAAAELDFSDNTKRFLRELFGESIGSPSAAKKLDAIIEMLRPLGGVPAQQGLDSNRLEIIHGLVATGSNGAEVLTAINNLDRKVNEFMATQEERLKEIHNRMVRIGEGVDKLQEQLATLKANNPDIEDEIAAIEGTAKTIDEDVNPVVEQPPTGGGETPPEGGGTEG